MKNNWLMLNSSKIEVLFWCPLFVTNTKFQPALFVSVINSFYRFHCYEISEFKLTTSSVYSNHGPVSPSNAYRLFQAACRRLSLAASWRRTTSYCILDVVYTRYVTFASCSVTTIRCTSKHDLQIHIHNEQVVARKTNDVTQFCVCCGQRLRPRWDV